METNTTIFAVHYENASDNLMIAVASANPSLWLNFASRSANTAKRNAANIIEETLADSLLAAIEKVRPLVTA